MSSIIESTVDTLSQYALDVLEVAEEALATTDGGTPDRSYVDAAPPAWDCCPFLNVYVAALAEAPTAPVTPAEATAQRTSFGSIILATYVITAVRCAASIGPDNLPSVLDLNTVASHVQQDGWALWNGLRHAVACGRLFDTCTGVHFDGGRPINTQGGCVGWVFQIRAMVPGIPNPGCGS